MAVTTVRHKISATDARIRFGELMRHVVEKQQSVVVERSGEPHVVVISVDEYQSLRAAQERQQDCRDLVSQAPAQVRAALGHRELTPPEEMLGGIREERDEQLARLS